MSEILEQIDRSLLNHRTQARKLDPRAMVVPYDKAKSAIESVSKYYQSILKANGIQEKKFPLKNEDVIERLEKEDYKDLTPMQIKAAIIEKGIDLHIQKVNCDNGAEYYFMYLGMKSYLGYNTQKEAWIEGYKCYKKIENVANKQVASR